jgi:DNA repair protein RecO (recombination protein O)
VSVLTTEAVLLRSHPYSETSLILRFYTEARGNVSAMARGARRSGPKGRGGLESYGSGNLTIYVKESRELQTFKEFEPTRSRFELARDVLRFGGAAVLGELVLKHGGESAHPELFGALEAGLDRVQEADPARVVEVILSQAWGLVTILGYEPVLDACTACGRPLDAGEVGRFDLEAGGMRCGDCGTGAAGPRVGPGAREQLGRLQRGEPGEVTRPRAHLRLLSDFITYHVSGTRAMDSLAFLASLLPGDARDP